MLQKSRDHLEDVNENYFEHLGAAITISALLAMGAVACAVHAIVPGLCTRAASRCVARASHSINRRRETGDIQRLAS